MSPIPSTDPTDGATVLVVDDTPDKPDPKRTVRNVGPTFIPAR